MKMGFVYLYKGSGWNSETGDPIEVVRYFRMAADRGAKVRRERDVREAVNLFEEEAHEGISEAYL